MDDFAPWEILHAAFDAEPPARAFTDGIGGVYVVLWRYDQPVGHAWLPFEAAPLTPAEAAARAWERHRSEPGAGAARELPADGDLQPRPSVSVVVCTRDRPESLQRALTAIGRLDPKPDEVLVVDNASATDATELCVARFPGVRYVREPRPGLDRARNAGVRAANGAIIAFTDDDAEVHTKWIAGLLVGFRDPAVLSVTGLVLPAELQSRPQWLFETYWSFNKGYRARTFDAIFVAGAGESAIPAWEVGAGANMAFRREAFDAVGLFDERLDVGAAGCSGDSEFWYRLLAEGHRCRYEPAAVVFHHHRHDPGGFKRQIFGYMRGHTAALLVQHERYGHAANLRRLLFELPAMYARRLQRILKGDRHPSYGTLQQEVFGCFSGVGYYLRHARLGVHFGSNTRLRPPVRGQAYCGDEPVISIIIPCYNHANFLADAIDSVLGQQYPHAEIVVVDDGSTDHTAAVVAGYPQVRYVHQSNQGLSAARNAGIAASSGELLVFLDADDCLLPGALAAAVEAFRACPEAAFVFGEHECMNEADAVVRKPSAELELWYAQNEPLRRNYQGNDHFAALLKRNYISMHATVTYRREVIEAFGGFDVTLGACEDYDLYLKIARSLPVHYHGQLVAQYRRHGKNMSENNELMLRTSISVLQRQRSYVAADPALREAYRTGIAFWKTYYGRELAASLAPGGMVRPDRVNAANGARTLLRYAPELLPISSLFRACRGSRLWLNLPGHVLSTGLRRGQALLRGRKPA